VTSVEAEQSRLDHIRSFETGCEVKDGFFSMEEFDFLRAQMKASYEDKGTLHYRNREAYSSQSDIMSMPRGQVQKEVIAFLKDKLKDELPGTFEIDFTFHKNYHPYSLHTDAGYGEEGVLLKQGIIPLEFYPEDKQVYTVIMHQRHYLSSGFHPKSIQLVTPQKDLSPINRVYEYKGEVDMPNIEFLKYWEDTPMKRSIMKGFTVHTPFLWKKRSMAIWDRSMIHCSSDFKVAGAEYKIGLMWIARGL
jgi:hypothetical protein